MTKKLNPIYWHKKYDDTEFVDITYCLKETPSWTETNGVELLQFELSFDDLDIFFGRSINAGDIIAVTTDSTCTEIIGNGSLVGRVIQPNITKIGYDSDNSIWRFSYAPRCQQLDFSDSVIRSIDYKSPILLSDIIDDITLNYTGSNLGGRNSNPVLSESIVPKYKFLSSDITINNVLIQYETPLQAIKNLLSQNSYFFKIKYTCEPDPTNNLKIFATIIIYNSNGIIPYGYLWNEGITDDSLKSGLTVNPNNLTTNYVNNEPIRLAGDKSFNYDENLDVMVNSLYLIANVRDKQLSESPIDNTTGVNLVRYQENATGEKDTFSLPPASDIFSVALLVSSDILSSPSPSTTILYVPTNKADLMNNNDIAVIKVSGIEYFRTITVNKTTGQITLSSALPSTPIPNKDYIDIIGNKTIYSDNEDIANIDTVIQASPTPTNQVFDIESSKANLMQPDQNCKVIHLGIEYIGQIYSISGSTIVLYQPLPIVPSAGDIFETIDISYASRGVVKNTKEDDRSTVRFLPNDIPNAGQIVVVYYYRLLQVKSLIENQDSIRKYGLNYLSKKIDGQITKYQLEKIIDSIQQPDTNQSLELISYRDEICQAGFKIAVQLTPFINKDMIVNSVSNKIIKGITPNNTSLIEQTITLRDKRKNLEDLFRDIEDSIKSLTSNPAGNEVYQSQITENINMSIVVKPLLPSNAELNINESTRLYYKDGTAIDFSSYGNDGSFVGGVISDDNSKLFLTDQNALLFDGATGYINAGNSTSLNSFENTITLEVVFRLLSENFGTILKKADYLDPPINQNSFGCNINPIFNGVVTFIFTDLITPFQLVYSFPNVNYEARVQQDKTFYIQLSFNLETQKNNYLIYNLSDNKYEYTENKTAIYGNANQINSINNSISDVIIGGDRALDHSTLVNVFDGIISRIALHSEFRTVEQGLETARRLYESIY